jgi:hypothetical protein
VHHNLTWTDLLSNPDLRGKNLATERLNHGRPMADFSILLYCTSGLANFYPQDGHVIRDGLAEGRTWCTHIDKRRVEGIELTIY